MPGSRPVRLTDSSHGLDQPGSDRHRPALDRARRAPGRRRHPPDPAAAADGRPARGQRLRDRDRGGADPGRRRLGARGVARAQLEQSLAADRPPGSATSPGSWSPTCTATTTRRRSTVRREFGAHVSLGIGERPTLDLILRGRPATGPDGRRSSGAPAPSGSPASGSRRRAASAPDLSLWEHPDTWLEGDHRLDGRQPHPRRGRHPRPHPGPLRLRRPRRPGCCSPATTCCRRSRRRSGSSRRTPTSRSGDFLASLAKVRAMPDLRLLPAHGAGHGVHARPGRRAGRPPRRAARAVPGVGRRPGGRRRTTWRGDLPWTRHEQRLADLDVFNAALAVDGDDGAPRAARRAGPGHPARGRRGHRLRPGARP